MALNSFQDLLQNNQVYLLEQAQFLSEEQKGTYQESTYQLYASFLAKLDQNNKVEWVKNITNYKLKLCNEKEQLYGLRMNKGNVVIELWTMNLSTVECWLNHLKLFTIQVNFEQTYLMDQYLGSGAFAKVYRVIRRSDRQEFAAKVLNMALMKNRDVEKAQLMKEIQILRKLNHPGLVKLYEVYETEQDIILVFEYLKGGEILNQEKKQNDQYYTEQEVAVIMARLLDSIDYMHTNNIMHRDLKPENLILRNKDYIGDLIVTDFGLADYYDPQGNYLFKRCGTPGYVAPEVLQDKIYDTKIDIFSAGTIMFLLLSGSQPFIGQYSKEILLRNSYCMVDYYQNNLRSKVSNLGLKLLKSLLDPQPASRPTAKQALEHPWFKQALSGSHTKIQQQQMAQVQHEVQPNRSSFILVMSSLWNQVQNNTPQQFTQDLKKLSPIYVQNDQFDENEQNSTEIYQMIYDTKLSVFQKAN